MKKYLQKLTICFALLLSANIIHAQSWSLTGNAGTINGTNFIGTTDNVPFNIRVNNYQSGKIDPILQNTFFGYRSGVANTTGGFNTATGNYALYSNTTGSTNIANGYGALYLNTIGNYNIANGYGALYSNISGSYNMANGANALRNNTTGSYNIADGYGALLINTTGSYNFAAGYGALNSNISGSNNLAAGYTALYNNSTGIGNVAYGANALQRNTTGNYNTAIGFASLYFNTGIDNSGIGAAALYNNSTGKENTAIGYYSLFTNTIGSNNTTLGDSADVTTGNLTNATAIGFKAKVTASNTIQLGNSSVTQVLAGTGTNATLVAGGLKITGGTIAEGKILTSDANGVATWQTPGNSTGWTLTGNSGTVDGTNFIGTTDNVPLNFRVNNQKSGRIDPALANTFYGFQSGNLNSTGSNNTAIGYDALLLNTSGSLNTANGDAALYSNATGGANTANGYEALYFNTSGSNNVANGIGALYYNTTGGANTAGGEAALYSNSTGGFNTAEGYYALYNNYTGSDITALGDFADVNADGYVNATAIGANSLITGSNRVVLGNTALTGIYAEVTGITALSDLRYKKNIQENVPGLVFINLLKPVTYNYDIKGLNAGTKRNNDLAGKQMLISSSSKIGLTDMPGFGHPGVDEQAIIQKEKIVYTGLVAQDVETAAKKVNYDFSGIHKPQNDKDPYGLNYTDFVVPLIKSVQELSSSNDNLQNQVSTINSNLQIEINNLKNQNIDLQNRLDQLEIKLESFLKGSISSGSTTLSSARLEQNIPNPFNQTTLINYYVPEPAGHAIIKVTGMNGQEIKTVQLIGKGSGQITLQTALLESGNYTYSLYVDGNLIDTKVMVLER